MRGTFERAAAAVLSIGLATAILVNCAAPPHHADGPPTRWTGSLSAGGQELRLIIAPDRVGLVAPGAEAGELEALALEFGLYAVADFPGGIHVCGVDQTRSRGDLTKLTCRLARERPGVVQHAGLVATLEGSETPIIITHELVVQFRTKVPAERIRQVVAANACRIVRENPFVPGQYLLAVEPTELDALAMCGRFRVTNEVSFAEPNFVPVVRYRQDARPDDPLLAAQWHHENVGQGRGTPDADIDSLEAWEITRGGPETVIAVIDDGFDVAHPDLAANLWFNGGEIAGDGVDNDRNGFVDDIHGWDFAWNDATLSGFSHGTAVAGCAAARADNRRGVAGTCPECGLMLIRNGASIFSQALAFDYARVMGADIITNSWGYAIGTPATNTVIRAIERAAAEGREGLGCVILFAMNNATRDDCSGRLPDLSSLPQVIAVSGASNLDRKVTESASGDCMDVLGPTHRGYGLGGVGYSGTLNIATTDLTGRAGYNDEEEPLNCAQPDPARPRDAYDYTLCFGGTSAATPIVAGAAGLVLHAASDLTRVEVQRLLQDTTDRIEDSAGRYSTVNGFSDPPAGPATHGFGRVNAFEAVRLAAADARPGAVPADVFVRDHRLDWGNTEQPSYVLFEPMRGVIGHWESPDIRVDAPPLATPPLTSREFDAHADEAALPGERNRVYVRVRNRGPAPAAGVTVKLLHTAAATALPPLPADFWAAFPGDAAGGSWRVAGTETIESLAYCGPSVAGTSEDVAAIVVFDLDLPANAARPAFLAVVESPDDPLEAASRRTLVTDLVTATDNNVAARNVQRLDSRSATVLEETIVVRNPHDVPVQAVLRLGAPRRWQVVGDRFSFDVPFQLGAGQETAVSLQIAMPERGSRGTVTILQERVDGDGTLMGGATFEVAPAQAAARPAG